MSKKARREKRERQRHLNQHKNDYKPVKQQLISDVGSICMLCGKKVERNKITWHHIKPRAAGGKNSYENSGLLCPDCHVFIHIWDWRSPEYIYYTSVILNNKYYFLTKKGTPYFEFPF
jgi:5-methylcytosine-specific restriction endonuclease McrA